MSHQARRLSASFAALLLSAAVLFPAFSEEKIIELWKGIKHVSGGAQSVMFMSRPEKQNGSAVIICPGGSYHHLGMYNEGHCTAAWFNSLGVTTFVLRYRVAEGGYHYPCQFEDIQRAIQLVRSHAEEYGIDAHKIGAIGFSAGGHLVTMAGAFASSVNELEKFGIQSDVSLRPDFVIPVYPVVSMRDDIANIWSRKSLLGSDMSEERKDHFSMEKQIPADMPPCYVVACHDDPVVMFVNSELLCSALAEKRIPYHFAVYDKGGHGFGMLRNSYAVKNNHWDEELKSWLEDNSIISRNK
jgi:acetyl esterase/lipase